MARTSSVYRLCGSLAGSDLSFPLREGPNQVGSDHLGHVVLRQAEVSRRHALVLIEPHRLLVIDEESKNGTFVNGRRIHRAELSVGDTIGFGPIALRLETLHPDDAELAVELGTSSEVPAAGGPERSTASVPLPEDRTTVWLRAVTLAAREMARGDPACSARALQAMVAELGLRGACLVDLAVAGEPGLRATAGSLSPALYGAAALALQRVWRQRGAGAPAEPCPDAGGAFTGWTSSNGLGLLLAQKGSAPISATLARALLEIVEAFSRDRTEAPSAAGGGEPTGFPEDYVPGVSSAMSSLYQQMRTIGPSSLPVLILGETGVGKEHLARTIHLWSPRRDAPLVPINCAAVPVELLEAELFGIGARVATGVAGRTGKLAEAEGGTLLLDEIAEMPVELQAKLLRVLQEGSVEPLGLPPQALDVRVVAATNADLDRLLEAGRLRRDLYYRLAGFVLHVPPLRERREDIPPLVEAFVQRFAAARGEPIRGITVRAMEALTAAEWPGNVRELKNSVERLVWACPPFQAIDATLVERIAPRPLQAGAGRGKPSPPGPDGDPPPPGDGVRARSLDLEQLERDAIREAMRRARSNQVRAAQLLGISRHRLRRRLKLYGLLGPQPTSHS